MAYSQPTEEKKLKNFKKRIIKRFPNFKEVKERKDADALIIINKNDLSNYDIRLNDFTDKQIEKMRSLDYEVYYFKNTNPHDKRLSTIGTINRRVQGSSRNN